MSAGIGISELFFLLGGGGEVSEGVPVVVFFWQKGWMEGGLYLICLPRTFFLSS